MNDRWERLIDLYHSAVMLPADERATLLAEECGDDRNLQADVERMIVAHHRVSRPTGAAPVITAAPPRVAVDDRGDADDDGDANSNGQPPLPPMAPERRVEEVAATVATTDAGADQSMEAYADAGQLSIAERLELFLQVCSAIGNAQRCGVAYGELRTDTILVSATGIPRLPELTLGDDNATPATDVRSLGIVLDRLLGTGVSTAAGARRPLRRELDTIVLKAIRQDGEWRYPSMDALVDDIRRYLDAPPARERRDARRPARPAESRARRIAPIIAWTVAAAAVIALGVTVAPRLRRPAPVVAPVIPKPVFAPRTRLLVTDLSDSVGDPQLASTLSDALRVALAESPSIAVVATRPQSAGAELSGSIEPAPGGAYLITLQLTTPGDSSAPTTLQESAADSNAVVGALSRLAARLRAHMGESATSIAELPRLEDVTSASLPALRAFADGSKAIRAGDRAVGIRALRTAVAQDTGFASAHRLLGLAYRDAGDRARSRAALDHATLHQARLPFYERNFAVANQAMTGAGGYAAAIDAYNRILAHDPRDARVLNSLGMVHAARREYAVQESLLVRAIAVDSDLPALHTGLAMATVNQGKYDDASRVLEQTEQRFPGLRTTQLARIALAASRQDWASAERAARETSTRTSTDSTDALDGLTTLGSILMAQGRLGEAEQAFRRVIALGATRRAVRASFAATFGLAYLELRYRHAPNAAVAVMDATLARFPFVRLEPEDQPYDEVARFLADAGQPKRAGELMEQAAGARSQRSDDPSRRWTAGAIAMAQRRAWEGEIEIQGASEALPCPICALPDLARAYEVAGKPDSAIETYERYLRAPWQRRFETDATELGFAMKRLGELYQQRNDGAKAAAQYTALLQLWHGADSELAPLIADVRRRLEQTSQTTALR